MFSTHNEILTWKLRKFSLWYYFSSVTLLQLSCRWHSMNSVGVQVLIGIGNVYSIHSEKSIYFLFERDANKSNQKNLMHRYFHQHKAQSTDRCRHTPLLWIIIFHSHLKFKRNAAANLSTKLCVLHINLTCGVCEQQRNKFGAGIESNVRM